MMPDHILGELLTTTKAEYTLWFSERVLRSLHKKLASINERPKEQRASALDVMRDEIITDVTSLYKMVDVLRDTLVISEEDIATELERRSGNITGIYADGTPTQKHTERKLAEKLGGRGWSDIAYHFVIAKDGTVAAGRDIYLRKKKRAHKDNEQQENIS